MQPRELEVIHHLRNADQMGKEIRMSLSAEDFAHLASVLTNLYSDRPLAVIREYCTNAYDSHVEAENPNPILVTLPTQEKSFFRVQDFGVGLSVDDIENVFSLYGKSTKRDSDLQTGVLGLGCKAALCYAISFTVIAVKEGVKAVALVTKAEDGVGSIQIMDTMGTDEPNGVTVEVPVKAHDIGGFRTRMRNFAAYWKPGTMLVDGEDWSGLPDNAFWLDPDIALLPANTADVSKIVMGNVAYPFTTNKTKAKLVVFVPMGSVHFTPSRESLQNTRLTMETITTIEEFVTERFSQRLQKELDALIIPFEQARLYMRWRHLHGEIADVRIRGVIGLGLQGEIRLPSKGWYFNNDSYARKASSVTHLPWDDIVTPERHIVTHFPFTVVAPAHRKLLVSHGINRCTLLPPRTRLAPLEGRPNVHRWDDLVANAPDQPKVVRSATLYQVWLRQKSEMRTTLDPNVDIAYFASRDGKDSSLTFHYPDTQIVRLSARQVDRFCRLYPNAKPLAQYHREVVELFKATLTEDELLGAALESDDKWGRLATVPAFTSIEDPDLRWVSRVYNDQIAGKAYNQRCSERVRDAKFQGIRFESHPIIQTLRERYPILGVMRYYDLDDKNEELVKDVVQYLNYKYEQHRQGDTCRPSSTSPSMRAASQSSPSPTRARPSRSRTNTRTSPASRTP